MKRAGFTLMEVFIGLVLLSVVFFALLSVFPTSLASLRQSEARLAAHNLARQAMERWQGTDYQTLLSTTWPQTAVIPVDGRDYLVTVTIGDVTPVDKNVRELDVTVTWDATHPAERYSTCIYNVTNPR